MGSVIGIDIGGTFTDLAAFDPATGRLFFEKTSTTPAPDEGSLIGLNKLAKSGFDVSGAEMLKHGTTVVINSILERRGAKTALVTTEGFRDVLEIGRGGRPEPFNLFYQRLPPLVPRTLRYEIVERMSAKGEVLRALDRAALPRIAAELRDEGVEAIAVCFLHAYRNPAHEIEVAQYLKRNTTCFVTASHELSREFREFERTSTTVINAFVGPRAGTYIGRFRDGTKHAGFDGRMFLMGSNGGVLTVDEAERRPVLLIESGPVGGAVGAAEIGRMIGSNNIISFDMGGTTAKALMIENGRPAYTSVYYAAGYNRGYAVQTSVLDVVEVGTGGGSIAGINEIGALAVGPRSAGAVPGPACYGAGGTEPTVTDANLVLGRLHPDRFLGGEMRLDPDAARGALSTLASAIGKPVPELAAGIINLAVLNMASAIKMATVERGHDPRDFAMIAYGGAGPLHAAAAARDLGIRKVVIPNHPGHFCAFGMLYANLRYDQRQTVVQLLDKLDLTRAEEIFQTLEGQGRRALDDVAVRINGVALERYVDARYRQQEHTIRIELPSAGRIDRHDLIHRFETAYATRYGHCNADMAIEIVNLGVAVDGLSDRPVLQRATSRATLATPERRQVMFDDAGFIDTTVWQRDGLAPGIRIEGPAIIEEPASTTLIFPGDVAEIDDHGQIHISIGT